jgi:hypothetical protein
MNTSIGSTWHWLAIAGFRERKFLPEQLSGTPEMKQLGNNAL